MANPTKVTCIFLFPNLNGKLEWRFPKAFRNLAMLMGKLMINYKHADAVRDLTAAKGNIEINQEMPCLYLLGDARNFLANAVEK